MYHPFRWSKDVPARIVNAFGMSLLSIRICDASGMDFLCLGLSFFIFLARIVHFFIFEQGFLMPLTDFCCFRHGLFLPSARIFDTFGKECWCFQQGFLMLPALIFDAFD